MVIKSHSQTRGGFLMVDAMMGIAVLCIAVLPVAYGFHSEARVVRATYQRAVAMEIIDGELEILAAGKLENCPEGTTDHPIRAGAAANLPPGRFSLTRHGNHLRLEWAPKRRTGIGTIVREVTVK